MLEPRPLMQDRRVRSLLTRAKPAGTVDAAPCAGAGWPRLDAAESDARVSPCAAATPRAAAASATTSAMPMPQLNTRSISSAATPPVRASQANTGGSRQQAASSTATVPSGSTRGRLPGRPPPVMCAAAFSSPARCSASSGRT